MSTASSTPTSPRASITREAWLLAAVERLRPWFAAKGWEVPPCQVSCGFASTGVRSGHVGQCWSRGSSPGGLNQLFVSPALSDPIEVLDTLVHELVHAVDDCRHKHGREFKRIALSIGLKGPMRSASAGPQLRERLAQLADALARDRGPYPHAGLSVPSRSAPRRARPRARCRACGFTVPMLRQFLHVGPPLCPVHRSDMEPLGDWEALSG